MRTALTAGSAAAERVVPWHAPCQGRRVKRPATRGRQGGEVARLVASARAAEHLARDTKFRTQRRQWNALLVKSDQLGSKHRLIGTAHASPAEILW